MRAVEFKDLGVISYAQAWAYQQELQQELIAYKRSHPKENGNDKQKHYLLFCEHPPVYTLGKSGKPEHLLLNTQGLEEQQIEFFKINRGGDITYHGPGQLVVYPIFDLEEFFTDVHKYVRFLEEAVIRTLADFGLKSEREEGYTGVWIPTTMSAKKRKIAAIGVHLSRWVTMHGLAFNINPDLRHFEYIIPCGIQEENKSVTSLTQELQRPVEMQAIKDKMKQHFSELFEFEYIPER